MAFPRHLPCPAWMMRWELGGTGRRRSSDHLFFLLLQMGGRAVQAYGPSDHGRHTAGGKSPQSPQLERLAS